MFYGFGLGFGLSLVYSPSLTMVGHYWKKRFGIINGVVTSGSAVFTLSMYYLLEFLMNKVGVSRLYIKSIPNVYAIHIYIIYKESTN